MKKGFFALLDFLGLSELSSILLPFDGNGRKSVRMKKGFFALLDFLGLSKVSSFLLPFDGNGRKSVRMPDSFVVPVGFFLGYLTT